MSEPPTKRRHAGGRPPRKNHTSIVFGVRPALHVEMKLLAKQRQVLLLELYAQATKQLLERRAQEPVIYFAAPIGRQTMLARVMLPDDLHAAARQAIIEDNCAIQDFFETAVRLYLDVQRASATR
jgi:hypothetical protein